MIELFHKGLDYYYHQDWDNAIKCFKKSEKYETIYHSKDINPSAVFIKRCYEFIDNPPDKDWDGHYRLDKK